ncbi:MAG: gamma-glutamylcyclotransferase [Hyphomicrobiales bacterium]|nr:gamma-glutamylcyclotransferase [Hyphomicrobiales bacterium]
MDSDGDGDIWVFGYGSLMWHPGFDHVEARPALLRGYHRALCIYSTQYRGRPGAPGLVLGLDRGGSCMGRAFRIAAMDRAAALAYLDAREMTQDTYMPRDLPVVLDDGRRVAAHCYVVRRDRPQYTGKLTLEQTVALVRQGEGWRGTAREYLANTVAHLDAMGIADGPLHRILRAVENAP